MLAHGAEVQVVHPLATWVTLNMILHPLEGREQHLSPLEVAAVSFGDRMNLVRTLMGVGSLPPCEPQGSHSGCRPHSRQLYPLNHLVDILDEPFSDRILMGPTEESQ